MCVQNIKEISWVHRGCSVQRGVSWVHRGMFSTLGDTMSTLGGYHKYIGVCSVHRSFQYKLKGFITLLPHMHHGIPPMYSWYPPDVLMISPRCTHDIPPMYSWYPPMYSSYPPDVLNISRCTEHPPMYWMHITQGEKHWLFSLFLTMVWPWFRIRRDQGKQKKKCGTFFIIIFRCFDHIQVTNSLPFLPFLVFSDKLIPQVFYSWDFNFALTTRSRWGEGSSLTFGTGMLIIRGFKSGFGEIIWSL